MNTTPATPPDDSFRGTYATIEHWRGVAALMVFFFHTTLVRETFTYPGQSLIQWITRHGWYGVHLFFVLSGFCIASNLYRLVQSGRQPLDFLRNRLLRIYPTYWATCLLMIVMSLATIPITHIDWHQAFPPNATTAIANTLLLEPYFGVDPFLVVSWSLVYEIGFYLLVTLGFWFYRMGCHVTLLVDIAVGLAVLGLLPLHFKPLYILGLWNEFVMGGLVFLALYYQRFSRFHERLCLAGIVGLAGASWLLSNRYMATLFSTTAAFALLLYYLHRWDNALNENRVLRPLLWIGTFSYSLYLLHSPLISRTYHVGAWLADPSSPRFILVQLFVWISSLLGCWIFYKLCEQPIEKWRHARKPPQGQRDDLIFG